MRPLAVLFSCALSLGGPPESQAQDATRGAALYLRLPNAAVPSTQSGNTQVVARITLGSTTLSGFQAGAFSTNGDCNPGRVLPPAATCTPPIMHRPTVPVSWRAMLQMRGSDTQPAPIELIDRTEAPPEPSPTVSSESRGGGGVTQPYGLALLALACVWLWLSGRSRD